MPRELPLAGAHAAAGALLAERAGWRLPELYGRADDPGAAVAYEYANARESAAVADLSDRAVLAVTGPLRQKFLHNILSNDVLGRTPGQGCAAALMSPKGHLLALMRVLVKGDAIELEVTADRLPIVEQALVHYRVAAPVRFQARAAVVLGLLGPAARDVLRQAGCDVPDLAAEAHVTSAIAGAEALVARAGDLPAHGYVVHTSPEHAETVWKALVSAGARPLGRRALDALRVEDGHPWYGNDVTEDNLLHETGLLAEYHSPTKGCYIGQEVVARLEARGGNVNKMMRGLRLSAAAAGDTAVRAEGREVGRVTTAAVSPRRGPIALAYVHRSHSAPGSVVEVAESAASVVALPFAD